MEAVEKKRGAPGQYVLFWKTYGYIGFLECFSISKRLVFPIFKRFQHKVIHF